MPKRRITFERVVKEDYDKVIAIRRPEEIYGGTDYLPDYFNMWMDMPHVECYAVAVDGIYRTFGNVTYVDGGQSVIFRCGRTHKDFEGQGMSEMFFDWFIKNSPKAKQLVNFVATGGSRVEGLLRQIKNGTKQKIMEQEFRTYFSPKIQLLEHLKDTSYVTSAKTINEEVLGNLLSTPKLTDVLFPEGRLIVDWVPYRPMKSNSLLMTTSRTSVVVSGSNNFNDTSLSFGNYFNAHLGFVCNIDIYGKMCPVLFKEHMILHLKNSLPHAKSEVVIVRCYCREKTDWTLVSTTMEDMCFEKKETWDSGLICTEERFPNQGKL